MLAKAVRWRDWSGIRAARTTPRYDAERTADLFCLVCNRLRDSHARGRGAGALRSAGLGGETRETARTEGRRAALQVARDAP